VELEALYQYIDATGTVTTNSGGIVSAACTNILVETYVKNLKNVPIWTQKIFSCE
jgi:hypothetical protein